MTLSNKEIMAKAPPCPERTLKTPLPKQSSSSSRDEGQWNSVEDRRRQRVAFEEAAKRMLRYPEDSEDSKVGVTELQEQLEIPKAGGVSIRQITQQAMHEKGQKFLKFAGKEKKRYVLPVWPDGTRS